jgi:cyanate permease
MALFKGSIQRLYSNRAGSIQRLYSKALFKGSIQIEPALFKGSIQRLYSNRAGSIQRLYSKALFKDSACGAGSTEAGRI